MIARLTLALSWLAGCYALDDECTPPASEYFVETRYTRGTCPPDVMATAFDNQLPDRVTGEPTCTTRTTTGTSTIAYQGCVVAYEWQETFDELGGVGSVYVTRSCTGEFASLSCELEVALVYHPDRGR